MVRLSILGALSALLLARSHAQDAAGKIAFNRAASGPYWIEVMNADGTDVKDLTDGWEPCWSPNGKRLAFVCNFTDGKDDVCIINADKTNRKRLTHSPEQDRYPAWSPDGDKIAFMSKRDGNFEIYVVGVDGSNETRLTRDEGPDRSPAWSPDSKRIAFESYREGSNDVYVMDADGSNVRKLTDGKESYSQPAWSPDGQKLALVRYLNNKYNLCVCATDGADLKGLLENKHYIRHPVWSGDGKRLFFSGKESSDADNEEVYTIEASGGAATCLTADNKRRDKWHPAWAPR